MSAGRASNVIAIGVPNAADVFARVTAAPPAEREGLLAKLCGPHEALHARLAAMLRAYAQTDATTLAPGSVVADRYELHKLLGRGSTAVVWAARDRKLQRDVALKIFETEGTRRRWREVVQEAWAVADVDSQHVIRVHDVGGEDEDVLYIDMQLSRGVHDGRTEYGRALSNVDALTAREAAHWIEQAARGVQAAHDKNVFSGDVKPHNMLLEPGGRVAVTDFGLGIRLAGTRDAPANDTDRTITLVRSNGNIVAGTPAYMSPEQAEGTPRPLDPTDPADRHRLVRADVYGLGASLYHLLADHPPYRADFDTNDRDGDLLAQVRAEAPPPVEREARRIHVPRQLARIVQRAMARDPGARYHSAAALADDLERFRSHLPTSLDRDRRLLRARLFARRRPALVLNGIALVVLGVLVAVGVDQADRIRARDAELLARDAVVFERDAAIARLDTKEAAARRRAEEAEKNAARSVAEQDVKVRLANEARARAEAERDAAIEARLQAEAVAAGAQLAEAAAREVAETARRAAASARELQRIAEERARTEAAAASAADDRQLVALAQLDAEKELHAEARRAAAEARRLADERLGAAVAEQRRAEAQIQALERQLAELRAERAHPALPDPAPGEAGDAAGESPR